MLPRKNNPIATNKEMIGRFMVCEAANDPSSATARARDCGDKRMGTSE